MFTAEQMAEMPIEDLRLHFAGLMGGVVTAYGDDLPVVCPGSDGVSVSLPGSEKDDQSLPVRSVP